MKIKNLKKKIIKLVKGVKKFIKKCRKAYKSIKKFSFKTFLASLKNKFRLMLLYKVSRLIVKLQKLESGLQDVNPYKRADIDALIKALEQASKAENVESTKN